MLTMLIFLGWFVFDAYSFFTMMVLIVLVNTFSD